MFILLSLKIRAKAEGNKKTRWRACFLSYELFPGKSPEITRPRIQYFRVIKSEKDLAHSRRETLECLVVVQNDDAFDIRCTGQIGWKR